MAKQIDAYIKLQVPAGQANPSPPVGPALGQHGLNIMDFCKAFNAETQSMEQGLPVPVVITVYADKTFTFVTKTPPASVLLKKVAKIEKDRGALSSFSATFRPLAAARRNDVSPLTPHRHRLFRVSQRRSPRCC